MWKAAIVTSGIFGARLLAGARGEIQLRLICCVGTISAGDDDARDYLVLTWQVKNDLPGLSSITDVASSPRESYLLLSGA